MKFLAVRGIFILLCTSLFAPPLYAQTFTIPGVDGIEFDTTGGDFSTTITDDFTVFGITVSPVSSLTFTFSESLETFEIDGSVETSFDGETIEAEIDFVVTDEALESLAFNVTTDFELNSLSFSPENLGFEWYSGTNIFGIYGSVAITFDDNTVYASLGQNLSDPGILIDSGDILKIDMSIYGDLEILGLEMDYSDVKFQYSEEDDQYGISGEVGITVDGNEIFGTFGNEDDPGILIENGSLVSFNLGVNFDFTMKDLTISPNDLTFRYNSTEDFFEMYGDITVTFDGEEADALLGSEENPGFIYSNGQVTHINFGITADFSVKGMGISPDNLTFQYDTAEDFFEMYGDVTFSIGNDDITAVMGDEDDPGLIVDKGTISHVNIGVTEDFEMSGLKIKTTDLGVEWNSNSSHDYHIYGDANLSIDNETIDTDFGTYNNPGIVIRNGNLHSFEVDVNSDLKFGNLEVTTKDVDIKYSSSKFEVTGKIEIDEVFSLSVTLGSGDQAGLEIDVSGSEPKFKIDDLTIDIQHANLGTVDLKNFELEFNSSGIVESDVDVILPTGSEIDAKLKFTGSPARLDAIDISYRADNLAEAIEIFEGVQLAYLEGSVENLTHTSDLKVHGEMETIYGGGFSMDGKSATLLEMKNSVTITKYSLDVNADINVGAYRTGTDSWHYLLGHGDIDLYARFGHYAKATANVDIPGDPMIKAKATVYLDNHKDFDALVDVTFYVPHSVPIIGGKKLGSADGAIRYNGSHLSWSYAAGWVRVKTFWHTYHYGAKYYFSSRHISTFSGSSTIDHIENDIHYDESHKAISAAPEYVQSVHSFTVTDNPVVPNTMLIEANWGNEIDSVLVTVLGPEGIYELTRVVVVNQNDSTTVPDLGYEENMDWVTNDTSAVFLFTTPAAFSEEEQVHAKMLTGRYQVVVSIPKDQFQDSVAMQIIPVFQIPEADINVEKSDNLYEMDIDYWTVNPDSTFLSFYANTEASYDSAKLITHVTAEHFDDEGFGTESITYVPDHLEETDTLYFYAVIDDGVNPPTYSELTEAHIHTPDLYGTITFPSGADSLAAGLRIYVDADGDSSFDVASTGGLELFGISGEDGEFALSGLTQGTYDLRIVLPPGYRIQGKTTRFSSEVINYSGEPVELDIEIEAYVEEN